MDKGPAQSAKSFEGRGRSTPCNLVELQEHLVIGFTKVAIEQSEPGEPSATREESASRGEIRMGLGEGEHNTLIQVKITNKN